MRSYWPLILLLAAMWGASYLFIKVAVEDIPPAAMTELRVLVAGLLLAAYLVWRMGASRAVEELRAAWRPCLVLGVINGAVPMGLVAWGETHIDSSVAGIAQSTVPIFTFLLAARFLPHERVGPLRIAGVALGFLGVAALTGLDTAGGWWVIAGTLAVVLSSLSYASGGVYGQLQVRDIPGPVLATGSMLAAALVLAPLALADPPRELPGTTALAGLVGLILVPTFAGQLLLFRVLRLHGSRKLSIVTYLMPAFAVVYGAVLLDESVTAAMLVGFALIAVGAALASGQRFFGVRVAGVGRVTVSIRRATPDDVDFLVELVTHEDVEPYLAAVRAKGRDEILEEIARTQSEPEAYGVFVIEVDGERAGTMRFERSNERSRIAGLGGLAVHPDHRGGKVADTAARLFQRHLFDELGFHRLQMEIYGFNERAMRHAERAGFMREGVRRKAYWRNDAWVDGVLFGLVAEDLET